MTTISSNIFNTDKTDYATPSLFMGQNPGLVDTINKSYPAIWDLYMKLKSLDWDANEFDFTSCNVEFKTCHKSIYDIMIKTLAWQWEADTTASRMISPVVAPFVTSTELWACWQRVSDNEMIHALTYSEIVRNSFDKPDEVITEILKVKESLTRLEVVSAVFAKTYDTSHKLALGLVKRNQKTYNDIFMFTCAMFVLERIQFMASFAVTFAIVDTGLFIPIGSAVQKICQDEYEIHAKLDKAILDIEFQTGEGLMAFNQCREEIYTLINEVVQSELNWVDYLFSEGRELVGINADLLKQWVLYCAKDVYEYFRFKSPYTLPTKNPIGFIEDWINIDRIQSSPQEQRHGAYLLGNVTKNDADKVYSDDL